MRILLCLLMMSAVSLWGSDDRYEPYGRLLDKYVHDSRVDYKAWSADAADKKALDEFLTQMSLVELGSLSEPEQQAFYINLYNAGMLKAVLDHFPIASVKDIKPAYGVFRENFIKLGGKTLSLDDIEKGILLEKWDEPRIHVAVNCASASCPPLRGEPYTGAKLDAQLTAQAKQFANSFYAAQLDRTQRVVYVSSLFDWYADDFPEKPVVWLNRFRSKPLPTDYKVKFLEYDWSLNETLPNTK